MPLAKCLELIFSIKLTFNRYNDYGAISKMILFYFLFFNASSLPLMEIRLCNISRTAELKGIHKVSHKVVQFITITK